MQIGFEINFACHVFMLKFRYAGFAVFLYQLVKVVSQFVWVHFIHSLLNSCRASN